MKLRLDQILVDRGFFESREKAKAAVMAGLVFVDGQISDKPGTQLKPDCPIEIKGDTCPYVGRGGYKLEKALDFFNLDVSGLHCVDIGSSTGGFTDCMLQRGADLVYAIDVGTNQLAYKLRTDNRVVVMEQTNFRTMDPSTIPEKLDFACSDVSFISLKHIFPTASQILKEKAHFVTLIKPQFEAGREQVGKNGIVRDKKVHAQVIENVISYAKENGFKPVGLSYSPVTGGKSGNIEFLLNMILNPEDTGYTGPEIEQVVEEAHVKLEA